MSPRRSDNFKEACGVGLLVAAIFVLVSIAFGQSVVWDSHRSIAQIRMPRWSGSGTLIAVDGTRGLILSCRHVAYKKDTPVKLDWISIGESTEGIVLDVVPATSTRKRRARSSWHNDLAVIYADVPAGLVPVPVAKFDPDNGPWTCYGFRSGTAYTAITAKAEEVNGMLVMNCLFWGGESGGAVLDKYGQLVGVIVASEDGGGSTGVAANGDALQALLEKYGKEY